MAFAKPLTVILLLVGSTFADNKTNEVKSIIQQSGDNLSLSCVVKQQTVQFFFNNANVPESDISGSEGVRNYTLVRENINHTNAGLYECIDNNNKTIASYNVTIVSIIGENAELNDESTDSVELSCQLVNDDLRVKSLRWIRNQSELSNSSDKYTFTYSQRSTTLNISNPSTADAGSYQCVVQVTIDGETDQELQQSFSVNMAPKVLPIEKMRSRVEDEKAEIVCNVTGYPVPAITWHRKLDDSAEFTKVLYDERINTTANTNKVPNAKLIVRKLTIKDDKGIYMCVAENEFGSSNTTVELKVKDKLAAVWPFLGICAEVAILCAVIFIFEKKRSRKLEEEEEVDAVKQDLMNQNNGDDHELRQRNAMKT